MNSDDSQYLLSQDKKLNHLQSKADTCKNEYEKALIKVNLTIEQFESQYRAILNKIQDKDEMQIVFAK